MSFWYRGALKPLSTPSCDAYGAPHPLFRGREAEISTLLRACRAKETHYQIVYGSRQSGKTSLLLHFLKQLLDLQVHDREDDKVYPCRVNFLFTDKRPETALWYVANQIIHSVPALADYQVPPAFEGDGILRWFSRLPFRGRVVLLMEELGTLSADTRRDLGSKLSGIFDAEETRLRVIFFGGIELFTMAWEEVSPLQNVCDDPIYLHDLELPDTKAVLEAGFENDSELADEQDMTSLAAAIYEQVRGHPYLTQILGDLALSYKLQHGTVPDTSVINDMAIRLLEEDAKKTRYFAHLYETVGAYYLISAGQQLLNCPPYSALDAQWERLRQLGLAKEEQGKWVVRNPLIERGLKGWLARQPSIKSLNPWPAGLQMELEEYLSYHKELQILQDLLTATPHLTNEIERRSALAGAGLSWLIGRIDLSGTAMIAIPLLIQALHAEQRFPDGSHPFGMFLQYVERFFGSDDRLIIQQFSDKYGLKPKS